MIDKTLVLQKLDFSAVYRSAISSLKGEQQAHGKCPFHDDKKDSFSVIYTTGLFNCFGCGKSGDIFTFYQELKGVDFKTAIKELAEIAGFSDGSSNGNGAKKIIAVYEYKDEVGKYLFEVCRYAPKDFRPRVKQPDDSFKYSLEGVRRVPYQLPEILKSGQVFVVEGERDVETLRDLGFTATTSQGGANGWRSEYADLMPGKEIIIIPDADVPGEKYGETVSRSFKGKAKSVRIVKLPYGKDISDWVEKLKCEGRSPGEIKTELNKLIERAPVWKPETKTSVWDSVISADSFLSQSENNFEFIEPRILAKSAITAWFSPRGLGKTLKAHHLAVHHVMAGKKVLYLDRDNPPAATRKRLRSWGAEGLENLKIMTRDKAPSFHDVIAWKAFPFEAYDIVIIDSIDSIMEGVGEQDSSKTSKALSPILDIAHRENAPAVLLLGNTIKSGENSRGSGVLEDRLDIVFEVRDATGLIPTGKKPWWMELPEAGSNKWAERASRRKGRDKFDLAFVCSKFRLGEEPTPFIFRLDLTLEPWESSEVTEEVIQAGETNKAEEQAQRLAKVENAKNLLLKEISARQMKIETDCVPFLMKNGLTRAEARELIKRNDGVLWTIQEVPGKGRPKLLTHLDMVASAAKMPPSKPYANQDLFESDLRRPMPEPTAEIDTSKTSVNRPVYDTPISAAEGSYIRDIDLTMEDGE